MQSKLFVTLLITSLSLNAIAQEVDYSMARIGKKLRVFIFS